MNENDKSKFFPKNGISECPFQLWKNYVLASVGFNIRLTKKVIKYVLQVSLLGLFFILKKILSDE